MNIQAVCVNHNTSGYAELMLRSYFATHDRNLPVQFTLYDNASTDGTDTLRACLKANNIQFIQTGFSTSTKNNSHGEILRRFVLEHIQCSHFLFLDADVCFTQQDTLATMLRELEIDENAFGIGPRMSWDGKTEIPTEARIENPDMMDARLHPCCALVKNSPLFQKVVKDIGLHAVQSLWAERDEYLDTFKLMTRVMGTHDRHHLISSGMIIHFFAVSYDWDSHEVRQMKARHRDELLAKLHAGQGSFSTS
jgi:hypothetical protein